MKLKGLQSQLKILTGEAEAMKIDLGNRHREYQQKSDAIKALKIEIAKLSSDKELKVSEHAIIRYLERVKGVNIEEIESEILSDRIKGFIDRLGENGTYPHENGYSLVIKNFTVVSVL